MPGVHPNPTTADRGEDLYSRMLRDRIVFVTDPIDDTLAANIAAQLLYLDADYPDRDISLYINSTGGSPTAMTAIYDTMCSVSSDVQTVCLGQAVTVAALLVAAGTPGKRLIAPYARVVLQEPSLESGPGTTSDLEIQARELLRTRALMTALLAQHTGQSAERIDADLGRQMILTAAEAIEYGLADHVVARRSGRSEGAKQ
jgi:ATP-dependent Clp protease protease subunit